jgi:hypothetical protein
MKLERMMMTRREDTKMISPKKGSCLKKRVIQQSCSTEGGKL